jgi:MFS family permease
MIFAKDFTVTSVAQTVNWKYYLPWILCGIVFLSSISIALFRTKTKADTIAIYYVFIVSLFVPLLGILCGLTIKAILMVAYGTIGEAFPVAFMVAFAIWFFVAGFLDFGFLSGILAAIAGTISGYFFSVNLMSEKWDFFLVSILCVFLGFPIGIIIERYKVRRTFKKKYLSPNKKIKIETI